MSNWVTKETKEKTEALRKEGAGVNLNTGKMKDLMAMQMINNFVTALNDPERIQRIREEHQAIQEVKKDGNQMSERSTRIKQKTQPSKKKNKKRKNNPTNFKRISWLDYTG